MLGFKVTALQIVLAGLGFWITWFAFPRGCSVPRGFLVPTWFPRSHVVAPAYLAIRQLPWLTTSFKNKIKSNVAPFQSILLVDRHPQPTGHIRSRLPPNPGYKVLAFLIPGVDGSQ